MSLRSLSLLLISLFLTACASVNDIQQRFAECGNDHAWEVSLQAGKPPAINTKDKDRSS